MSELRLLLCIGEMNDDDVVVTLLIVLFIRFPEFELRGMNLFDPPF